MGKRIRRLLADASGATSIEYAIIAGAIFIAIVAVVGEIGSAVNTSFADVKAGLQ